MTVSVPANITQADAFGADSPCNLDNCPIEWSIYTYRPSLAANVSLAAIFGTLGLVHLFLGVRWKSWGFMGGMLAGCISEVVGYIGRVMLYNNPFSFNAFMIQIGKSRHISCGERSN